MSSMTPGERVHAAVKGEPVDRVPFCFWHHFKPEGSGERLAAFTMEFFVEKFHLDIAKIMPDLPYPAPEQPFVEAEQMRFLPRLNLDTPMFAEQLVCIRALRSRLGSDYPILLTLFSPLTYALRFMGKQKGIAEARKNPDPFEEGLGTIAANLRRLMEAAIEAGASGIFFSCMGVTTADFTREEYARFGRPYDPDYPISVMSWSDRVTGPSLSEALTLTDKCLMGGLWERGPLTHGSEAELENEILSAISQTKGRRLILANGCSVPDDTPEEWLQIARRLVDNLS